MDKVLFPNFAQYEFAPFQRRAIKRITSNPEWFEVLSWSRELAKSTCTMFCVMYLTLTGQKRNVILTSSSFDNAVRLLDPYRANLEANGRIIAYYGQQQSVGAWTEAEFITKQGVAFRALGAGQSPRGSRKDAVRPDVLLVDDFDTDQDTLNPDIIQKRWDWWEKALYPTRSVSEPTLVIFCGNIIAKDCCVVRAGAMADHWDIVNIRDKDGHSTWPEKTLRSTSTVYSPRFPRSQHRASTSTTPSLRARYSPRWRSERCHGSPSSSSSWLTATPLRAKARAKRQVVQDGLTPRQALRQAVRHKDVLAQALNAEFIDWYVQLLAFVGGRAPVYCYMENNKLQDPFFQQVFKPLVAKVRREQGVQLYIRGDEEKKTDKATRIEANLEPMNRAGNLILNEAERDNPHMKELLDQFTLFTLSLRYPADGPDAVEGGNRIIDEIQHRAEPPLTRSRADIRTRNKRRL